jgi:hypothetical protein
MGRTCIAINAAVLTTAVGVDTGIEADIGAIVESDDGA